MRNIIISYRMSSFSCNGIRSAQLSPKPKQICDDAGNPENKSLQALLEFKLKNQKLSRQVINLKSQKDKLVFFQEQYYIESESARQNLGSRFQEEKSLILFQHQFEMEELSKQYEKNRKKQDKIDQKHTQQLRVVKENEQILRKTVENLTQTLTLKQSEAEFSEKLLQEKEEQIRLLSVEIQELTNQNYKFLSESQLIQFQAEEKQRKLETMGKIFEAFEEIMNFPIRDKLTEDFTRQILTERLLRSICFPSSQILSSCETPQVNFLHKNITTFLGTDCYRSKLLYRFDPLNQVNFHRYFDGKPKLMIIIKTVTGVVLGGITEQAYKKESSKKPGNGILFNLTAEKVFKLKNDANSPVAPHDDQFLIFGNSDLRIKAMEERKILFSNFGRPASIFNADKCTRSEFLRSEGGAEVEMQSFQIYTIQPQSYERQ